LQQPAGFARPATYFHLLAQMKVGKAKGLNTIWSETTCHRVRLMQVEDSSNRRLGLAFLWKLNTAPSDRVICPLNSRLGSLATGTSQIVFRPSSLVTFFWASRRK
jgi:hypothetical protein